MGAGQSSLYPFVRFSREDWARLPADASFALSEDEVRKIGTHLSLQEATQIYLPLSRLLYLHVSATQGLYRAASAFLAEEEREVPYVVGIAGSVAAGKSTVAQVLRALISRWPGRPEVGLVSTDGFLYPNRVLRARGLMDRKGFPESYDVPLLLRFLSDIKSGRDRVSAPIHSHLTYDILPDRTQMIGRPDVLVVEGLNMLEAGLPEPSGGPGSLSPTTATSRSTWTRRRVTSKNGIYSAFCACGKRRSRIARLTSTVSRSSRWSRPETWPYVSGTRSTTPTSKRTSSQRKTGRA